MPAEDENWTISHFSQANPSGPDQGDVPALLRRVADSIAALGDVEIQDLVLHTELDLESEWSPSVTVYYHPREGDDAAVSPLRAV